MNLHCNADLHVSDSVLFDHSGYSNVMRDSDSLTEGIISTYTLASVEGKITV